MTETTTDNAASSASSAAAGTEQELAQRQQALEQEKKTHATNEGGTGMQNQPDQAARVNERAEQEAAERAKIEEAERRLREATPEDPSKELTHDETDPDAEADEARDQSSDGSAGEGEEAEPTEPQPSIGQLQEENTELKTRLKELEAQCQAADERQSEEYHARKVRHLEKYIESLKVELRRVGVGVPQLDDFDSLYASETGKKVA